MNRFTRIILVLLFAGTATAQSKPAENNLMSEPEYKAFLLQVDAVLPKWEAAFKGINLEKFPQLSYARGKSIADQRELGLLEVANCREFVARQRTKHTVSGELGLKGFLDSLMNIGIEMVWEEDANNLKLTQLDKYSPELSSLLIQVSNDVYARVRQLEEGSCPISSATRHPTARY